MEVRGCWAACLGNCSGKISREHVVSRSVFAEEKVAVQGFSWCIHEPLKIGLASLTANILCTGHNNALSPLDTAAGQAMEVFRESVRISDRNKKLMPWIMPTVRRLRINARLLERWMLKTTLNIKHASMLTKGELTPRGSVASREEAEICFGEQPFVGTSGMYAAYSNNMQFVMSDKVEISTILDVGKLSALRFDLHGFRFVLNLRSDQELPPLESIPGMDSSWAGSHLSKPFKHVRVNHLSWPSHYIDFDWG